MNSDKCNFSAVCSSLRKSKSRPNANIRHFLHVFEIHCCLKICLGLAYLFNTFCKTPIWFLKCCCKIFFELCIFLHLINYNLLSLSRGKFFLRYFFYYLSHGTLSNLFFSGAVVNIITDIRITIITIVI